MKTSRSAADGVPKPQMSSAEIKNLADELIQEKGSKIPARTRAYLKNPDIYSALRVLVDSKIGLKDIQRGFVDKLDWKVPPPILRAFMKEEFGYPPEPAKKVGGGAKKSAGKTKAPPAKPAPKAKPRAGSRR